MAYVPLAALKTGREELESNARLIAAAPDLLAALKFALRALENLHQAQQWDKKEGREIDGGVNAESQARAAIAKAEGRS